jgi:uncharacterized cupin superfamily protein
MNVKKPTQEEIKEFELLPTWEKEESIFEWEYDSTEQCLIIEGQAKVTDEEGNSIEFGQGDFVEFPKGLKCTWEIIKKIKKHYRFI